MKRTTPIIILVLLQIPVLLPAQKQAPGYFVDSKGDTVTGYFNGYRQWTYNPATVSFAQAAGAAPQLLTPLNCRFFMVNPGDAYETHTIKRMVNSLVQNNADTTPDYREATVFLRVVFNNGRMKLLEYNDRIRVNYFLQFQNGQPQELVYRRSWVDNVYAEDTRYRQQLADFCAGEPGYQSDAAWQQLQRLPYNDREIAAFLYLVTGAKTDETAGKRLPLRVTAMAGVSVSALKYRPQADDPGSPDRDFDGYLSPVLGLGITVYQQRNFGRNFFNFCLLGSQYSHTATYLLPASVNFKTSTLSGTLLELAFMPGRNFIQTPELSWYLSPGLSLPVLLGNQEKVVTGITTGPATQTTVIKNKAAIGFTVAVQTGLLLKKHLGIWLRYKHQSGVDPVAATIYRQRAVQAGVGYRF